VSVTRVRAKIAVEGVGKVFASRRGGTVTAIEHVDLDVAPGELVSILGPSGCGKSTLLYIVGGFEEATRGRVVCDGVPVTGPGPDRGIVFQEFALFGWRTVLGNVAYGLAERGLPRAEQRERALAALDLVGLADVAQLYPKELSGGMKQRAAIARALAVEPDVLLMDEPFGALDAQTRTDLQVELAGLRARLSTTVLFVTHSVEEAIFLSDRVVVLSPRPAVVREVVPVAIPRPREYEQVIADPRYAPLHRSLRDLLRGGR